MRESLCRIAAAAGLLVPTAALPAQERETSGPVKPPALRKGDTIALIAPASPLSEAWVRRAIEYLRGRGFAVKAARDYGGAEGYLAAPDEVRALELEAAFSDPEVRAVFCLRGGYGSPRILDRLDYDLIRRNPKVFVGYSDITALLCALNRRAGLIAFHGPVAKELGAGGLPSLTEEFLWRACEGRADYPAPWGPRSGPAAERLRALAPGVAEGPLRGGNLSVLVSLLATPYEPDLRGAILFLEEVNEKTYRIDRMLNQLRLAGRLAAVGGVLLGSFTGCGPQTRNASSLGLDEVLEHYFGNLGVPVLAGYPAGHSPENITLPFGARVRLDAGAHTLTVLESPTSPTAQRGNPPSAGREAASPNGSARAGNGAPPR